MTLDQRIEAFSQLGNYLEKIDQETLQSLAERSRSENPWFTPDYVRMALNSTGKFLNAKLLKQWTESYALKPDKPKTVALVMAGNIPLVGFHDFLCVLLSGHRAQVKLSSKDSVLLPAFINKLVEFEPDFKNYISLTTKLENFDAIIATGSDNSARYFEYYFGKYPNIIRKNRTSCAVLTGSETDDELRSLGTDIFTYFGLGCRNVSKVYIPNHYNLNRIISSLEGHQEIIHHHKYCNNYDYQKSILLVNSTPFLDNGFILLRESSALVSPIAVLYYEYYASEEDLRSKLEGNAEKLQCIVGNRKPATVQFGQAQFPALWDYADHIDTLKFLDSL